MNGSRSAPPRHGDRSSLDALNRTIEGLEARIQGLMARGDRQTYSEQPPVAVAAVGMARPVAPAPAPAPRPQAGTTRSVLAEIRERQRMLEESVAHPRQAGSAYAEDRRPSEAGRGQDYRQPPFPAQHATHPAPQQTPPAPQPESRYTAPAQPERQHTAASRLSEVNQRAADNLTHFTDALSRLRHDLRQDLSEGFGREMQGLREEVRSIKAQAEDQHFTQHMQSDLARLAQGIDQLTLQATPEAADLRTEFEELRAVMEGLAREDSLQHMQNRWQGLEERIQESDATAAMREEIVALAYRIDDIRNQLGLMADSPVIRGLEDKLLSLAGMMEKLGARMQPNDAALGKHFGQLDERLDEISRAITANAQVPVQSAMDDMALERLEHRLEDRLNALMDHMEAISRQAADNSATDGLSMRIELLAGKIEEMADEQAAIRLEERIEHLQAMVQQLQSPEQHADLVGYLSEISRKIDALDTGPDPDIGARLDYIASRIDEIEQQPAPRDEAGEAAFMRIEDRLQSIAARLDEAAAAPRGDDDALHGLEAQIAHLSTLIAQPSAPAAAVFPPELDHRMAAIESYMATNDEYIVEAARQAAETVVEAYSRNLSAGTLGSSPDLGALTALAADLKQLEDLARGSESRTHQTFEALHGTLVQIADRLDSLEGQMKAGNAPAPRFEEPARQAVFAAAATPVAVAPRETIAPPMAAVRAINPERHDEMAMAAPMQTEARLRESSAITSTLAEQLPPEMEPVEPGEAQADEKPAKAGLLSGLTRRFRPAGKPEVAPETQTEPTARTVVDPTPSIDPSDVLPPERENELLEPGSGAPDVKKILERVRASQAAGEFDRDKSTERADYIAAARRAAKAAAQEADPSKLGSMPKPEMKAGRAKPVIGDKPAQGGSAGKAGSAFSQHRRPIMMAVGAVLLALMSLPLIKTVTQSSAPEMAAVEQNTAAPEAVEDIQPDAPVVPEVEQSAEVMDTVPPVDGNLPEELSTEPDGDGDRGAQAPTDNQLAEHETVGSVPTVPQTEPQPEAATAPQAAPQIDPPVVAAIPAAGALDVPAGIQPQSLADAAGAGDPNALFEIGSRFSDGRGVPTDLAQASKWYKLAADRGLAPAQYRFGNMLEKGTGVSRNLTEAMSYYRRAASAGNASAMHNLAVLYASGAAGQPDYEAAVEWFRNAANLGIADSQFNLAILYARGNGVKPDLEESYKWFGAAAQAGDQDAAGKRDEVAKAMRKEQLDSARAKLDAWKAQPLNEKANAVNLPDEWAFGKGVTTASIDMSKAIRNIQAILNRNGFDAGTADGKMGQKTVSAIKAFQTSIGQEPTGKVNDALVRELLARNG